ncbi:hypothetical protein EV693_10332 [Nicoletella semolina]|uniref:Uncharacterized protein n=1 Tax=Nicoletella semolina TaxID=271160 RepID=A0A4R2NAJ8_9PAST|nr:hypothetical protein EV693_10332 [Nicoletella semolina]
MLKGGEAFYFFRYLNQGNYTQAYLVACKQSKFTGAIFGTKREQN